MTALQNTGYDYVLVVVCILVTYDIKGMPVLQIPCTWLGFVACCSIGQDWYSYHKPVNHYLHSCTVHALQAINVVLGV